MTDRTQSDALVLFGVTGDLACNLIFPLLTAIKSVWRDRLTTVFPRQGHDAHEPEVLNACPAADVTVAHIGELLTRDLPALPGASTTARPAP